MIAVIELILANYSAALRLDGFLKLICSPGPVAQAITFRAFGALFGALPHRPTPIEMLGRGTRRRATAPCVLLTAHCSLRRGIFSSTARKDIRDRRRRFCP